MNPRFDNLPPERQDQILNGAMAVFGRHGYKKASTDEICRAAGISKGLLYHYFSSKRVLYLSLYRRCLELVTGQLERELQKDETDFFEILNQAIRIKLGLLQRHPAMFDLLMRALVDPEPDLALELQQIAAGLKVSGVEALFQNVDTRKFRPGIDLTKALEIMAWVSEGFMKRYATDQRTTPLEIGRAFEPYMQPLRQAFYREEYL